MMTLYHGSYMTVRSPDVTYGREEVDFGQGFYLTRLRKQATDWARAVAGREPRRRAKLNKYAFDKESAIAAGFRFKEFVAYDMEWLDYVVDCRNGGRLQRLYDVVEGGVANDNVIDTVEDFENGVITAEQALGQLRYKKVNHQICIHHQDVVDRFLRFQSGEGVSHAR